MDNSFWNIFIFIVSTVAYFMALKPILQVSMLSDKEQMSKYNKNKYFMLSVYFIFIVFIQFFINTITLYQKCGGTLVQNLGTSVFLTFIPWIFLFGVMLIVLEAFPFFKNVFSDIVGYFIVSDSANKVLTELLIQPNIQEKIDQIPDHKKEYQATANAIIKLFGNMSILINQIVTTNFLQYWTLLTPLMKEQYKNDKVMQQKLLNIVTTRENVGEGFWYGYTAILLISIVQYYIMSRGCVKNTQKMQEDYQQFLKDEEEAKAQAEKTKTTYTTTA